VRVTRPVVRSFSVAWIARAARWVRAGGHAIVWESERRAKLVVPRIDDDDEMDLGLWAMMDLGLSKGHVESRGALAGLSWVRVPHDCLEIVRARVERDSVHAKATRSLHFDCLACAACCVENEVTLSGRDVTRLRRAGHEALTKRPWSRRGKDGRLVLVLFRDKSCKQLRRDNTCTIYEARPDACRTFPPGSECCLYSQEDVHGWRDGAPRSR
jgi:Fe-S-cluster containining protein